ncbi:MAG TPA: alpha/beta hydrolase [Xanthobacteraceae bacterium]|jgi:arylformamidase|nr:alpha/beta hydrolase [Xanthobacteraceae bacterium]
MPDYEAEYNIRARVPEHPQIFAAWVGAAAAYREEAAAARRAELGIRYGASARQTIDLFLPAAGDAAPLALFIHGGYWRSLDPSSFSHLARGLNEHGVAVAVAGYDLCPQVRIAEIVDQMRHACLYLWRRFGRRMLVFGHSAGGHLAACMLATDWKAVAPDISADLVPAAYSISGLFDLAPLIGVTMNADLRLDAEEARRVSPLFWPAPAGRPFDAVVGALESSEFLRQSRVIAEAWGGAGVATRYEAVPQTNHFTVLDALADAQNAMVSRLAALAGR